MSEKKYYFVYGTLKEGHGNHRVLRDSKKVGNFVTKPEFTMISLGGFPGVIEGGDTSIKGEIYEVVDKDIEAGLDRLEGYSPNSNHCLYNKNTINLDNKDVFIYIFNAGTRDLNNYKQIKNGTW